MNDEQIVKKLLNNEFDLGVNNINNSPHCKSGSSSLYNAT